MKTACFNRFTLELPTQAVEDIARPGANDDAVAYWAPRIPCTLDPDTIRAELREYGAWDAEELADDDENWKRILWVAAHNIAQEEAA